MNPVRWRDLYGLLMVKFPQNTKRYVLFEKQDSQLGWDTKESKNGYTGPELLNLVLITQRQWLESAVGVPVASLKRALRVFLRQYPLRNKPFIREIDNTLNWLGNWLSTAVIASSGSTGDVASIQEMKTRSPTGEAALLKYFLDVLETSEASDIKDFIFYISEEMNTHSIPEPPLRVDMPPTDGGSGVVGTPRRGTYDFSPPGDRRDEEEIYVATSSPRKSPWADDENIPPLPYDENITADDENMRLSPPSIFVRPINRTSPRKRPRADDENMRFSPPSIPFQSINRTSPGKRPRADDELQLGTRLRFSPPSILPFNLSSHSSPGEPPLA